jgi:hypothetical protein
MKALRSFKTSAYTTKYEMIPAKGEEGVSGAVLETALYSGD